jgi:hypothetical protein
MPAKKREEQTMIISNEKWDEIIAAVKAAIERWKVAAEKHQCTDLFSCEVLESSDYVVIITTHKDSWRGTYRKAVARSRNTGHMVAAKVRRRGVFVTTPDPKAWKALVDKPAARPLPMQIRAKPFPQTTPTSLRRRRAMTVQISRVGKTGDDKW